MNLNEVVCKDGGILKELYKSDYQITMRTIPPHTTVGGHKHLNTNEWFFLHGAVCEIRIQYDNGNKLKLHSADKQPFEVSIPKNTGHEIENLSGDEAVLIFISDKIYDPDNPDKSEWKWNE